MLGLGYASVPAVKQYLQYAQTLALDIDAMLLQSGISPAIMTQENERITGEQLQQLLALLITEIDDPLFGLKSGELVQTGSYSVLGYITMTCATFAEVLECVQPYEKLVGDMGVTSIVNRSDEVQVHWHCAYPMPIVREQMIDNIFASWVLYSRWLSGQELHPKYVHLQRQQPSEAEVLYYEKVFACPVLFAQADNCVVFPHSYLAVPLRQPDNFLRKTLEQHALQQMSALEKPQTFSVQVKDIICFLLAKGITRKDMVAAQLNMSEKTLQRKLQLEETSYQKLLDEARLQLAQQYLCNSNLSFDSIAMQLGFAEVRSFFRRFKIWTGQTPSEYRESFSK